MADVEVAVVNGDSHKEEVIVNGDHVEEITTDISDVKIEVKTVSSVKSSHTVTTVESVKTVEVVGGEEKPDVVLNGDKPDVVLNGDEKKDAEKETAEEEKEEKEEKDGEDKVEDGKEEVVEVVENGKVAEAEGETPEGTPSKKKNGLKGIKIQTTPNSPVGKLLRFFACGSDSGQDAADKPKQNIEAKKSTASISDPKAGEWEGNTKVKFGMDVVTKVDQEDNIPRHYAAGVTKNGLAEQFGIRADDELLLMNLFNLAGRGHQDVMQLFADEEVGRKTHLVYRRVISGGKKEKKLYDYHQVTGFIQMLMVAEETKPVNDEYQVNNLNKSVSREPGAEGLMLATEKVQISTVTEDTQKHLCFRNNGLSIDTDCAPNDEFTFEMLVRVSPSSPIKTRVFFRHKKEDSADFMYMAEQEEQVVMKDNEEGEDNKDVPEEKSLLLQGVSNKSQTYALQTHTQDGTYVTLDDIKVKVKTLPEGTALSDATEVHFKVALL